MTNVQFIFFKHIFRVYFFFFLFLSDTFFYSNVTALVKLCNTVNRIGVGLFHTQTVCESNQPA